jgi:hypothetical protein
MQPHGDPLNTAAFTLGAWFDLSQPITHRHMQHAVEAMAWPYTTNWFARHARLTEARHAHNLHLALTHFAQRLTTRPTGLPYRTGLNYVRGAAGVTKVQTRQALLSDARLALRDVGGHLYWFLAPAPP